MAIFNKCCCCSLNAGVITIGILGLIMPLLGMSGVIYGMVFMGKATTTLQGGLDQTIREEDAKINQYDGIINTFAEKDEDFKEKMKKNKEEYGKAKDNAQSFVDMILGLGWGLLVGLLIILLLLIAMNVLLIVGACKEYANLLLPWLGFMLLTILGNVVGIIGLFVAMKTVFVGAIVSSVFNVGIILLLWLCVFSLYQEIIERRRNQDYQQPMQKM